MTGEEREVTGEEREVTVEESEVTFEEREVTGEESEVIFMDSEVTGDESEVTCEEREVTVLWSPASQGQMLSAKNKTKDLRRFHIDIFQSRVLRLKYSTPIEA